MPDDRQLVGVAAAEPVAALGRVADRDGRQLMYKAVVSESQVRRTMVGDLIQNLFRGDPKALLAHLVSEKEVAPGDLERIRALLADARAKQP